MFLFFAIHPSTIPRSGYLGAIGDSISLWTNLDPHTILTIFLPALIFGSAAAVGEPYLAKSKRREVRFPFPNCTIIE